jgi:hypothetical protein
MRGEEPEPTHEQKNQKNPAQFHSLKTSTVDSDQQKQIVAGAATADI